jgi:hypothetical protein
MADMTNEQAALQIEKLRNSMTYKSDSPAVDTHTKRLVAEYVEAHRMGAAALRGWVKTADRLPTKDDADLYGLVLWMSWDREYNQCTAPYLGLYDSIIKSEYWHHISKELKLPEVEE